MPALDSSAISEEDLIDDADLDTLVREAIAQVIGENNYIASKSSQWSANILEGVLKRLTEMEKPFKYIISCTLGQKAGAGLHITSSCRWEEATDGKLAVQWESATMQIIVITYWLAI